MMCLYLENDIRCFATAVLARKGVPLKDFETDTLGDMFSIRPFIHGLQVCGYYS